MTISSTVNRVSYTGNGVTTAFAFSYPFQSTSDLKVLKVTIADGTEVLQTITTHYTISGTTTNGVYASGGTVNMVAAPSASYKLVIYREPALTQTIDLVENDALPAETLEQGLDKAVLILQRLDERLDRAITLPDGFTATFSPSLPSDINTANAVLVVNAAGDGWDVGPTTTEIEDAEAEATAAAASAAAASASAAAAATAETNAELAETNAETAEVAAEAAQAAAEAAQAAAAISAAAALVSENNAETAETNAELAETNAEAAQVAAELAEDNAAASAIAADASADAAAASALATDASADAALVSETNAAASAAAAAGGTFTSAIIMDEIATPSTPAAGKLKIYPKSDNQLYFLNDGGVETRVGGNQGSNLLVNIGLAASVAANALTVAIKNSSGSDASTTSPIYAAFGNATITTGQFEVVSLTAALSLVVSSGSTLGQQNGIAADIYVYLINNAGTIKIGLSRIKLPEDALYTTVAEGGAGGADSSSSLYSDAVYSNVRVRCVGKITSTQATAGTWATAPSSITVNPLTDQFVGFRGTTNAGQAVTSGNAILFEDPIFDTHGKYNTATGVYTFGVAGKFRFSACITTDGVSASVGDHFVIESQKDASFYSRGKYDVCENTTSRIFVSTISDTIDVVVGTTLSFVFSESLPAVTLTADGRYNYMAIEKIS